MLAKKKTLLLLIATTVFLCVNSAKAQHIRMGGGLGYGSGSNNLNFYVNTTYSLPQSPIRLGAVLGYSIREENSRRKRDRIRGNINAYLMIIDKRPFGIYGLGGLNLSRYKTKYKKGPDGPYSTSNIYAGANVGGGLEMDAGVGRYFAEGKYIIGSQEISGFVVRTGLRIGI